jgi:thiamine monophosphate kinase
VEAALKDWEDFILLVTVSHLARHKLYMGHSQLGAQLILIAQQVHIGGVFPLDDM